MDFLTLAVVLLVITLLSIVIVKYWVLIFFIWQAIQIVFGIIATSWITAMILTFFNAFLTEKWEGFNQRWLYSGIFFTAATVIYFLIFFDIIKYGISFIRKVFKTN